MNMVGKSTSCVCGSYTYKNIENEVPRTSIKCLDRFYLMRRKLSYSIECK
jgi:hypothetical protein